jgi:hypothetical protein
VTGFADDYALLEVLQAAVPLWILQVRGLPDWERQHLARESASVVASQGDTLMFGSGTRFGGGTKERLKHEAHRLVKTSECASCPSAPKRITCCGKRFSHGCRVCVRGEPTYSAGEVFNFLARGLAVAACQPGGVTFADLHWCVWPHPYCPRVRTVRRPACCTCTDACLLVTACSSPPEGSECTDGCPWCRNGCVASTGQECCTPAPPPPPQQEPPPGGWRPDDEYGPPLVEDLTVTEGLL